MMSSPTTSVWGFIPSTTIVNPIEIERRNRIRISIAAYAYENDLRPIMSDAAYDELSKTIRLTLATGNSRLDNFFRRHFSPDTGLWIHKHPEPAKLADIYQRYYALLTPEERKRARRKARRKNR